MLNLIFLIFQSNLPNVETLPGGAPSSACDSMTPEHGVPSTTCTNSYIIEPEHSSYDPSDSILVTVRGKSSSDRFQGILMMARDLENNVIGTWDVTNTAVKTVTCGKGGGITHTSSDDKVSISAIWHSPNSSAGVILI
ncbi:unnamed protein product, partial [Didymodactylos carnosus]